MYMYMYICIYMYMYICIYVHERMFVYVCLCTFYVPQAHTCMHKKRVLDVPVQAYEADCIC